MPQIDPHTLHQRLVDLGEDWADKDAAANLLEETRKSVLAEISRQADGKSMSEREAIALATDAYREHLAEMVEARRIANRAKVNYDAARAWIDITRTVEATKRQEMGMR
jgi:membrane-bound lytic murein transglycosylase MltF